MSANPIFNCPNCGAPLQAAGDALQVECPYCGSHVTVPENLRPARPPTPTTFSTPMVVIQQTGSAAPARPAASGSVTGCIVVLVVLLVVGAGAGGWFFLSPTRTVISDIPTVIAFEPATFVVDGPGEDATATAPPSATPTPGFAREVLRFGDEGTGTGHFDDVRAIGVDGQGNIYTGEYTSGRIQKFDAQGQFVTTWTAPGKNPLVALTTDRAGHVYAVRQEKILKYDGASGELQTTIESQRDWFDNIALRPDGTLAAVTIDTSTGGNDIVQLDAAGNVVNRLASPIQAQTDHPELNTRLAVDGMGTIFAMGSFNNAVFQFTPEGKFANKFGAQGDGPGKFQGMNAIAVDSKSRVYVSDIQGIQVFDRDGQYLALIPVDGVALGMTITDQDAIFVAARSQVLKYVLTPQP